MRNARSLSEISTPIIRGLVRPPRTFDRRRRAVLSSMECRVLFKHDETPLQLLVSEADDQGAAVWLHRTPILVDPKDRGRIVVVSLTTTLCRQNFSLTPPILDWSRYSDDEQKVLREAIALANRTRDRFNGTTKKQCPTWHQGNVWA